LADRYFYIAKLKELKEAKPKDFNGHKSKNCFEL